MVVEMMVCRHGADERLVHDAVRSQVPTLDDDVAVTVHPLAVEDQAAVAILDPCEQALERSGLHA